MVGLGKVKAGGGGRACLSPPPAADPAIDPAAMDGAQGPWQVSAEQEYARNPSLSREDVGALRRWVLTQPHLPTLSEEMVIHLLHACFFDIERAKLTIETLYTYRATIPDFFDNWDPLDPELQRIVTSILIAAPLPFLDKDGNKILVCRMRECEPAKFSDSGCIRWLMMVSMQEIWRTGTHKGYAIVYDATGFTFSHMLRCSLSTVKNYINFGTYASPMRVVKIVIINSSSVIKKLFTLIKPFLSKDIINMMSFHTGSEGYFKDYSVEETPVDYGGNGESLEQLHDALVHKLTEVRQFLIEEEAIRSDESKRENGKSKKPVKEEANAQIRTLDID